VELNDAPPSFSFSRVVAESAFFRLIAVERDGGAFACRRLTPRGREDALAISRVRGEALVLASLAGRGAPKLEIADDDALGPFTVYEWIAGELFAEYTHKPVAPALLARVARACFIALAEVHEATDARGVLAVVHGDVRPANIVIHGDRARPLATLVDFGLARSRDHAPSTDGAFAGSIHYAAPEAARSEPSGQPEDVFALAMCILHAITNTPSRLGTTFPALLDEAVNMTPALPKDSPHAALVNAIHACFSVDPASRPRAVNVVHALSAFA
jgi:serine/threonine protein kinase